MGEERLIALSRAVTGEGERGDDIDIRPPWLPNGENMLWEMLGGLAICPYMAGLGIGSNGYILKGLRLAGMPPSPPGCPPFVCLFCDPVGA